MITPEHTKIFRWGRFVGQCELLCGFLLHTGPNGRPSFDGDQERDGYSLDWLFDQFTAGLEPEDVLIEMRKKLDNEYPEELTFKQEGFLT